MSESDPKLEILQQVKDGTITVSEALERLDRLYAAAKRQQATGESERMIRVKVASRTTGRIDTTIPLSAVKTASRFGILSAGFIPYEVRKALRERGLDLTSSGIKDLITMLETGELTGKLIEVEAQSPSRDQIHIEVFVE